MLQCQRPLGGGPGGGSARLRQDVAVEDALCRAALLAPAPEPAGIAATRTAAERALALKHASEPAALPHIVELRHGLCLRDGVLEPLDPAPAAPASQPRRARAP